MKDFVPGAAAKKHFGGFDPSRLAVADGPIPFRAPPYEPVAALNEGTTGLAVLPAFANHEPAAIVITEIWENHPTPWVEPVYVQVADWDATAPKRIDGSFTIFPVDTVSAFYTPFWRATWVVVPPSTAPDAIRSSGALLRVSQDVHEGAYVTCPIVPADFAFAKTATEQKAVRPFTNEPVNSRLLRHAWVDGRDTTYIDFGVDHFTATPGALVNEVPLYAFVQVDSTGSTKLLDLPYVLDDQPFAVALARRYDVPLASPMAIFVPSDRQELRDSLRTSGLPVPDVDAAIPTDVARAFTLRVAADATCFSDATRFPGDCRWLDSAGAIGGLRRDLPIRTGVQLTAVTLRSGAVVLP